MAERWEYRFTITWPEVWGKEAKLVAKGNPFTWDEVKSPQELARVLAPAFAEAVGSFKFKYLEVSFSNEILCWEFRLLAEGEHLRGEVEAAGHLPLYIVDRRYGFPKNQDYTIRPTVTVKRVTPTVESAPEAPKVSGDPDKARRAEGGGDGGGIFGGVSAWLSSLSSTVKWTAAAVITVAVVFVVWKVVKK